MTRRVRTPEGADYYDAPIGTPITAGMALAARSRSGAKGRSQSTQNRASGGGGAKPARGSDHMDTAAYKHNPEYKARAQKYDQAIRAAKGEGDLAAIVREVQDDSLLDSEDYEKVLDAVEAKHQGRAWKPIAARGAPPAKKAPGRIREAAAQPAEVNPPPHKPSKPVLRKPPPKKATPKPEGQRGVSPAPKGGFDMPKVKGPGEGVGRESEKQRRRAAAQQKTGMETRLYERLDNAKEVREVNDVRMDADKAYGIGLIGMKTFKEIDAEAQRRTKALQQAVKRPESLPKKKTPQRARPVDSKGNIAPRNDGKTGSKIKGGFKRMQAALGLATPTPVKRQDTQTNRQGEQLAPQPAAPRGRRANKVESNIIEGLIPKAANDRDIDILYDQIAGMRAAKLIDADTEDSLNLKVYEQGLALDKRDKVYGAEVGDPNKPADGPDGNWTKYAPYPPPIRKGTPAAKHFESGGGLDGAPEEGLFDYLMQQVGVENGRAPGLLPGDEGKRYGWGDNPRPIYDAVDPKRFRVKNLNDNMEGGVSPNYFVEELDDSGNVVAWRMFKGSSGFHAWDIENEVVINEFLQNAGIAVPKVQYARKGTHKGPKFLAMENAGKVFKDYDDSKKDDYLIADAADITAEDARAMKANRIGLLQMDMLDWLIGNGDRHAKNWMYVKNKKTGEVKVAIIDNGGSLHRLAKGRGHDFHAGNVGKYVTGTYSDGQAQLVKDIRQVQQQFLNVNLDSLFKRHQDAGGSAEYQKRMREVHEHFQAQMRTLMSMSPEDIAKKYIRR